MNNLTQILAYLKLHWATVAAMLLAVWAYAKPTVLAYISTHPKYSFIFGLIGVIVTFYWQSPITPAASKQ